MLWPMPKDPDSLRQAEIALEVAKKLFDAGYPTYLIGGVVRDSLLDIPTTDVDICTACPADELRKLLPEAEPWGKPKYSIFRIDSDLGDIEIARFREEKQCDGRHCSVELVDELSLDLRRRDFTVNALAVDPRNLEIIDEFGGMADLSRRLLRTIGDPGVRFVEDRLRMLRAIRFAAKLSFALEDVTCCALCHEARGIKQLSGDRIRLETGRILTGRNPGRGVHLLRISGLWEHIFPERADDPVAPGWDRKIAILDRAVKGDFPDAAIWSLVLLPESAPSEQDLMSTANILDRLDFSKADRRSIMSICKGIMLAARFSELPSAKAVELADSEELELVRALVYLRNPKNSFETELARRFPYLEKEPTLTGNDLSAALEGLSGAEISPIMNSLREAELSGRVTSPEEARDFIRARKRK